MSSKDRNKEDKNTAKAPIGAIQASVKKESPVKENKEDKKNVNTAVIFNGSTEIRRYTLEIHGKEFIKLAEEFAKFRNYKIDLVKVEPGIICPNCGHEIKS